MTHQKNNISPIDEAKLIDVRRVVNDFIDQGSATIRNDNELWCLNPTRNDKTNKSFSINLETGKYYDFATDEGGADIVSAYAYFTGNPDQYAAAVDMLNRYTDRQPQAEQSHLELMLQSMQKATNDHPYLGAKKINIDACECYESTEIKSIIGYTPQAEGRYLRGRVLVFPLRASDGTLKSFEMIDENGTKSRLSRKVAKATHAGAYLVIGVLKSSSTVLIAEGVATAITVHQLTGLPVVCCFGITNLASTISALLSQTKSLIVAADVTADKKEVIDATFKQLAKINGLETIPVCAPQFRIDDPGTDYNDLLHCYGVDYAKSQLLTQIANVQPAKKRKRAKPAATTYAVPDELLNPPGMVGDLAKYITDTATFKQPFHALAASLSFCGTLVGRKVKSKTNIRTNGYYISVGAAGCGKEHPRHVIKELCRYTDALNLFGGERLASDQAIFSLLVTQPSCIVLLDEFGHIIRGLKSKNVAEHSAKIIPELMSLYGQAGSYVQEKRRADHRTAASQPAIIQNPNLSLYATTVPGRLTDSLSKDEVEDGLLSRFLVFETDCNDQVYADPETILSKETIPDSIFERINLWQSRKTHQQDTDLEDLTEASFIPCDPIVIHTTPEADAILATATERFNKFKLASRKLGLDALWVRAREHTIKTAMIIAAVTDDETITADIMRYTARLIEFIITRLHNNATDTISSSDYERDLKLVKAYIRDYSPVTRTQVGRKFQSIKTKDLNEFLSYLLDHQYIEEQSVTTKGRTRKEYEWTDYYDEND
jgi:phage/plasmid primase-like uncharacterized protein